MPYRRLPTTDKARLRALEAALETASENDLENLAFSQPILEELKLVKMNFENALKQYEADARLQTKKSTHYKAAFEKAYLYVSHFIQVIYMNIERGELKKEVLQHYELNDLDGKIPPLKREKDLIEWGNRLIAGEQNRKQNGGSPIYNPSIALVKVNVENFREVAIYQNTLKKNTVRTYEKLKEQRNITNEFISRMWNEIEENVDGDSAKHKRQLAQEYGLVYIFRRKEKKKLRSEDLQRDLIFEFI